MKYFKKIIADGLYLLVFLLPVQTRLIFKSGSINGAYSEYSTISLYLVDILLLSVVVLNLLYFFWRIKNTNYELRIKNYWYLIAVLELIIFISIFVSLDKGLAFYTYVRFLLGIALFWLIISVDYKKLILIYSFLAGIFLQALLGLWQFLAQSSFGFKWLGLTKHDPSVLGTSVVETLDGGRILRAYGGLDHPNMLGGILAIGILILLIFAVKEKRKEKLQTTNYKLQNYLLAFIYYFVFIIFAVTLFFTFSRGAWLSLALGLITLLLIAIIKKDLLAQKKILKYILFFWCLVFFLFNQYSSLVLTRLSGDTRLEKKSIAERIESFQTAGNLIKDNWLLGAGIGNYTLVMKEKNEAKQEAWLYQPAHNVFLLIWAEIGVFGLLCISFLFLYILFQITRKRAGEKVFFVAILFSFIIMSLVDHWWWSLHFGILFSWLILGLILREEVG